jgi:hypothetical protein
VTADIWTIIGDPIGAPEDGRAFGIDVIQGALTVQQIIEYMPPIPEGHPVYRAIIAMQTEGAP